MNLSEKVSSSAGVRHLLLALVILISVVVVGVVGYILIEDMSFNQALYMTVITITTVGFREVRPLGTGGQYFTMVIVITGLGSVLFFLTGLFEFVLSEYLGEFWGRKRMLNQIAKLENHFVVCGYGRVGSSVAGELAEQGKRFVVIEIDEEVYKECLGDGYLCILGSATENHILEQARLANAVGLVSALGSDADNLYVVLTARVINPHALIVSRAEHPESEQKLEMVGADRVISPHRIAGKRMANLMLRPRVCEFLDVGITGRLPEYQLSELRVEESSILHELSIKDSRLRERTGVTVLAIRKSGESSFNPNPPPDTRMGKDDVVIVIGTPEQLARMEAEQASGSA
ncbi:MAG: potassium channel family protein [Candidatus Geothermincolia bacterium]